MPKTKRDQQKIQYSFIKVLTGSDLSSRRLAIMEASGKSEGPLVWLTAAIHGDEVGGIVVVQEIFRHLHKTPLLKGTLKALPLMNPIGFETAMRHLPVSEEDLNRSFPGDKKGTLSERIADTIFSTVTKITPALVLDLHNDWTRSVPYIILDSRPKEPALSGTYKAMEHFARATGFIIIEEKEEEVNEQRKTLSGCLMLAGIPALTIELGESFVVNEQNVRDGVTAIWNILGELGMVAPEKEFFLNYRMPEECRGVTFRYSDTPHAQTSGVTRFMVKPGTIVEKEDPIARIYNVFGKLQETVRAGQKGIVLGHSDSSVAFPGTPLAAFGVFL